jgi:hypothetical protein
MKQSDLPNEVLYLDSGGDENMNMLSPVANSQQQMPSAA